MIKVIFSFGNFAYKKIYNLIHYLWEIRIKTNFGSCGKGVQLRGFSKFVVPSQLSIGDNVFIGPNAWFHGGGGLTITDNSIISRNCTIFTVSHNYRGAALPYDDTLITNSVDIGRNAWIGMNANIIPGVMIGDGAIIGLGTTFMRDIPPLAIASGVEQRILGYRDQTHYEAFDCQEDYLLLIDNFL